MPIFKTSKGLLYFAHIPKCAGTTVENYLISRFGAPAFLDKKYFSNSSNWSDTSPQHIDVASLDRLFPKDFFDLSFAVVRSPVSRMLSAFKWQRDNRKAISTKTSFSTWLLSVIDEVRFDTSIYDNHLRKQMDLIPAKSRYFKLENGLSELEKYLDNEFGQSSPRDAFGHEKHSVSKEQLHASNDDIAIIESLYAWDYLKLDYPVHTRPFHFLNHIYNSGPINFAIKLPCHTRENFNICGDYFFGLGLANALNRLGYSTRLDAHDEWETARQSNDIDIVIRGQHSYTRHPINPCIYWFISNPEKVSWRELYQADHVFVASKPLLDKIQHRFANLSCSLLPQAFDAVSMPFSPESTRSSTPLFVGTRRDFHRTSVEFSLENNIDLKLYGTGWKHSPAIRYLLGERIDNSDLSSLYNTSQVVLNDHNPFMRDEGLCSNRVFEAMACGAVVVSDRVSWVPDDIRPWIYFYDNTTDFRSAVHAAQSEGSLQRKNRILFTERFRNAHSFDVRAKEVLAVVLKSQSGSVV